MARNNARLTHAQYDKTSFNTENTGPYSLPNGADRRFIDVVDTLPGYSAWFYSAEGDVMVSTSSTRLGEQDLPEALAILAERFNMVQTESYSSPNVITFEYRSPE